MGRLLSIDFGRKRCGIAVTDPSRIVAGPLDTVDTARLTQYLVEYTSRETVDAIIVGLPTDMHGAPSQSQQWLRPAMQRLARALPQIPIRYYDERFTSVLAHRAMIDGGMKKSDRRDKAVVDKISAAIILNDYLQSAAYDG